MLRYRMIDSDDVLEGETALDVVGAMAQQKFDAPHSLESYMHATARRASDTYHIAVSAEDPESFIDSLVIGGLMIPVVE